VFNVADVAIMLGAGVVVLAGVFKKRVIPLSVGTDHTA
jgi:lipoprotein signal peptidase